jgi:hypothetical protein
MAQTPIISFGTKNPRRNLPEGVRFKRAEILFQTNFLRTYLNEVDSCGIGGNQFEMPGYGIADFIWATVEGRIDAFEFKIDNWKKGVGQASRYRSYASRSFLVLPIAFISRIEAHIKTFHSINLGIWFFDMDSKSIVKHFTPAESRPLNTYAKEAALQILNRKLKFRQLSKAC